MLAANHLTINYPLTDTTSLYSPRKHRNNWLSSVPRDANHMLLKTSSSHQCQAASDREQVYMQTSVT